MLDPDQQKVVDKTEGYYCVLAGPGSGKSTTLLHRAAKLNDLGSLLCVSFTSEAARNMRDRAGKNFPKIDSSCFSTLHSLALKFAHDYADSFPFQLADNPLAVDGQAARAVFEATKNKINYQVFTTYVSLQKRLRISPQEAVSKAQKDGKELEKALGYQSYQNILKNDGLMDFDDLISMMVNVLETRPDIRSKNQYNYVMQDEAQDACELDWTLLKLLTSKHKNLACYGDPSQSIFGFRGSSAYHFENMAEMFPGTETLTLGNNYRSTKSIVEFVRNVSPNQELAKSFKAISPYTGHPPTITAYSTDFSEADAVVKEVSIQGPDDCAILARTNLCLRAVEEACIDQNVKYHLLGDSGYWTQPEVLNVLSWVRCCYSPTDNSIVSAIRSPFWPTKYLKKKLLAEEVKKQVDKGQKAWDIIKLDSKCTDMVNFIKNSFSYKHLKPIDIVSNIIRDLKALSQYKDEQDLVPDRDPVQNLKELIRISSKHDTLEGFLQFVRKVQGATRTRRGVCLSTIHSFKGKEAENIFLVSANSGVLPHKNSTDILEERRLFYVAASRPRSRLYISFWGTKSEFL